MLSVNNNFPVKENSQVLDNQNSANKHFITPIKIHFGNTKELFSRPTTAENRFIASLEKIRNVVLGVIFLLLETFKNAGALALNGLAFPINQAHRLLVKQEKKEVAIELKKESEEEPKKIVQQPVLQEEIVQQPVLQEEIVQQPVLQEEIVQQPLLEEEILEQSVLEEEIVDQAQNFQQLKGYEMLKPNKIHRAIAAVASILGLAHLGRGYISLISGNTTVVEN